MCHNIDKYFGNLFMAIKFVYYNIITNVLTGYGLFIHSNLLVLLDMEIVPPELAIERFYPPLTTLYFAPSQLGLPTPYTFRCNLVIPGDHSSHESNNVPIPGASLSDI
jgi:hypothetical protein